MDTHAEGLQATPAADLISQFENDIRYDAHSLIARLERSRSGYELRSRGQAVLGAIVRHLEQNPPQDRELRIAWGWILNGIEIDIDAEKTAPKQYLDTSGWIAWARRFAQ